MDDTDYVKKQISDSGTCELALPSKPNDRSKLFFETKDVQDGENIVCFRFNANVAIDDGEELKLKGDEMRNDFNQKVREYPKTSGRCQEIFK